MIEQLETRLQCGISPHCEYRVQDGWYICALHGTWLTQVKDK